MYFRSNHSHAIGNALQNTRHHNDNAGSQVSVNQRRSRVRAAVGRGLAGLLLGAVLQTATVATYAFDNLTPAQKLIYDHNHLTQTDAGQVLNYRYTLAGVEIDSVDDQVKAIIQKKVDDDKRDVQIDFLSGEHRMILPDFTEYRGNPIIIAMLEYSAQFIGRETGGGTLYFRNRIRDGLAGEIAVETGEAELAGEPIKIQTLSFKPFEADANLSVVKQFQKLVYRIVLSEDVPGGVLEIQLQSKDEAGEVLLASLLSFENVSDSDKDSATNN